MAINEYGQTITTVRAKYPMDAVDELTAILRPTICDHSPEGCSVVIRGDQQSYEFARDGGQWVLSNDFELINELLER
jgi:hypothetical protein